MEENVLVGRKYILKYSGLMGVVRGDCIPNLLSDGSLKKEVSCTVLVTLRCLKLYCNKNIFSIKKKKNQSGVSTAFIWLKYQKSSILHVPSVLC